MAPKTLYLVDISSYVFRAYYAIRPLQNSKGISTHATYGVINMLLKLIREKKPEYLVVVFDSPVPTFRKEIYPDYKANRQAVPEDLPAQFGHVRNFVDAYPLPCLQRNGFEADDLIATMVRHYREGQGGFAASNANRPEKIIIVSADKDLMQLVGSGVTMLDSMKGRIIAEAEVIERFGVGPDKVLDILALAGDASDNIPGVKGIGEKTATKLIEEWGSLENILENLDAIKGKVGEKIRADRENAILSKKLARLHDEVPMTEEWRLFAIAAPHQAELNRLYQELELKSMIQVELASEPAPLPTESAETPQPSEPLVPAERPTFDLVLTEADLQRWIERLSKSTQGFSFDTETTGLDPFQDQLVGLSFSDGTGKGCYIPVGHSYLGCPDQLPKARVIEALKPLMSDKKVPKWAQNAKFDQEFLCREGLEVQGLAGDSLIASYLLNPEGIHNLDHLAKEYLNHQNVLYADVVPKGENFSCVDLKDACRYAAEDAEVTFRLMECLHPQLKENHLWDCYADLEIPLVDVLFHMEVRGVFVDVPFLNQLSHEFNAKLIHLERGIYEHSGVEFNINSPRQLGEILFSKLGLPPQRKTKTGYSTDVDVLNELSNLHPMPKLLLEHRTISKLKSTYVDQLRRLVNPKSGRIHTSYNQVVTATGRLSSSDPNLQNIPIRTEEGRRIRQAFRAPQGWKILSADYSQIELRLLAAFSEEPNLVSAFKNNHDIHRLTAEKIFKGDGMDETLKRSRAKTVNFGILYGQSAFGLSAQLNIPQSEAKQYIEEFYNSYPGVRAYKEKVLEEARRTGEVRTWKGRRRLVPELRSQNNNLRNTAERTAFNTIFQGSAADLIKVAMIRIDEKLKDFQTRMIMQVHDELIFEVPEGEIEAVSKLICDEMENAIPCSVPLKVEVGVGDNWDDAH